jgi:hypothetical protein
MRTVHKIGLVLGIILVAGIGLRSIYQFYYPYGTRTCFLPCMLGALRTYASEHDGAYPDGTNSYRALAELHPRYLADSTEMLAGLSGDRHRVVQEVKAGRPIGSNECSWVYFPGLHTSDNPKLMLIYERTSGVRFDGMRKPGRAVGFVDNQFAQIPDEKWNSFVAEQEKLRAEVSAKHDEASK